MHTRIPHHPFQVYSFGVTMWESVERRNRFCREHYMNEHQIQWNWIYDADSMKLPDLTPHPSLVQAGGELLQGLNELVQACTVVDPDKYVVCGGGSAVRGRFLC